jgi:hypothetical protein
MDETKGIGFGAVWRPDVWRMSDVKMSKSEAMRANRIANACTAIESVLGMLPEQQDDQIHVMIMMLGHLLIQFSDDKNVDKLSRSILKASRMFYEHNKDEARYVENRPKTGSMH